MTLRIGFIVNSAGVDSHYHKLATELSQNPSISLSVLYVQKPPTSSKSKYSKSSIFSVVISKIIRFLDPSLYSYLLFDFIRKIEFSRLDLYDRSQWSKKYQLDHLFLKRWNIVPTVSPTGFVYRYSHSIINEIKSHNIDLLVRCGAGILRGEILSCTRFGVLSLHHADNRLNRGGPPGFWEVFKKQPSTGFIIQQLTDELDAGNVLARGCFPTQPTFVANQINIKQRSIHYLTAIISQIASSSKLPEFEKSVPYCHPLYKLPSIQIQLRYLFYLLVRSIRSRFRLYLQVSEVWRVAYNFIDWRSLSFRKSTLIDNPPGHFLADPFIFNYLNVNYCFVEDYCFDRRKGSISVYKLWPTYYERLGTVLEEEYHLSFPYIFEFEGDIYMVPEAHQSNEIRLYKSNDFPFGWKYHMTLIPNVSASDTMIFQSNNKWWLFTNINPDNGTDHCSELYIFWAQSPLTSNWTPHSLNPVYVDPTVARNGGLLSDKTGIYRVAQSVGFTKYGESASIMRINTLTPESFSEVKVSSLTSDFIASAEATHHLHSNSVVTAFDFCSSKRISN